MTESYKIPSKIWTAVSFIAAFIVYIGKDGLAQFIPSEYANIIPIIVLIAGYIVTQSTENKRVEVAEQLIREEYDPDNQTQIYDNDAPVLNDEYQYGDDDGC